MSTLEDLVLDLKGEMEQMKLKNEKIEKDVENLKEKDDQSKDDVCLLQTMIKRLDKDQIDMKEEFKFLENWSFDSKKEKRSVARDEAVAKMKSVVMELSEIYGGFEKMLQKSIALKMKDGEKEAPRNCGC